LERLGLSGAVTVVSKVPPIEAANDTDAEAVIERTLLRSLKRLRLERLSVCLLHRENDLKFLPVLQKMVGRGLIAGRGCRSTATGAWFRRPRRGLSNSLTTCSTGGSRRSGRRFAERHSRLRAERLFAGLLLMPEARIGAELATVVPVRRKLEALAREVECTMSELCMRYALSNPAVTSVLTGVDTPGQLHENLRVAASGPLPSDLLDRVRACVPELPESLVRPALWKN
jgi:aryl-alcohol dehydrogenase-like predicted oxidoreductase